MTPAILVRFRPRLHFPHHHRTIGTSTSKNRVFTPVRSPSELSTLLLLSTSSCRPLLTLWTSSLCPACPSVLNLLTSLLQESKIGEAEGGVGFACVEMDAPEVMNSGLAGKYFVTSIPTLLAFSKGQAQIEDKVVGNMELGNRAFLEGWVREAAKRREGKRGWGLFEGMFGR